MWRLFRHPTNRIYYARDRAGGRERRLSLGTKNKRTAEGRLKALQDRAFAAKVLGHSISAPTIREILPDFLDHKRLNLSAGWFRLVEGAVRGEHFASLLNRRLDSFSRGDIQAWQDQLQGKGLKPASINRLCSILGSIFTFAVDRELMQKSQRPRIQILKEERQPRRFFQEPEIKVLFEVSEGMGAGIALFVRLGILAGLRSSEILSLRRVDIDREHGLIVICDHRPADPFHPKSREERRLPIHEELWRWLNIDDGSYYFPSQRGSEPYPRDFKGSWETLMKTARIEPRATPHAMRHTFGTRLARAGCSSWQIQALMGHSNVRTTQIYIQMAGDHSLRQAVDSLQLDSPI